MKLNTIEEVRKECKERINAATNSGASQKYITAYIDGINSILLYLPSAEEKQEEVSDRDIINKVVELYPDWTGAGDREIFTSGAKWARDKILKNKL